MEEKAYMGIDPGAKGVVAIVAPYINTKEFVFISELNYYQLSEEFARIREQYPNIACVMEDVHAIFGSSAKATFNFGLIKGVLIGLLCANKIPFTLINPQKWQREMWEHCDVVKDGSKTNQKATSLNCATRLFPNMDFRRSQRCKKPDDNLVDALLMAEYARRRNL